jgi:hypothetical protein
MLNEERQGVKKTVVMVGGEKAVKKQAQG